MQRTSSGPLLCIVAALGSAVACNRTPEPTPTAERPAEKAEPAKPVETSAPAQETAPASATPEAVATASAAASATAAPVASSALDLPPSSASKITDVPTGHKKVLAKPVASVVPSSDDPLHGVFTLEMAIAGLPGKGGLTAEIKTDLGKLECELYADKAPITVANFVGLARGLRDYKNPKGDWVKAPAYDGTTFHRVVKGFMIQGGDPEGTGRGEPGYVIPDEVWENAYHSQRGLLCMANRGPNTNSMQFFIMDGSAPHLDSGYTIFGKCGPDSVVEKLASVEVDGDRSVKPTKIEKITIRRKAK
jgi:peptidyl-prolyl cis-trans isomerase A (cyclophilin A)